MKFKTVTPSYTVRVGRRGKYTKISFGDCHDAKSHGGRIFHEPEVDSVVVFDNWGKLFLVLEKTSQGVLRQEVPSSEAI